jgi:dehydrogenase/reductase SDR family protein 13
MTDLEVRGKRFLVTGASSGIGRAMVEALAAGGASVVLAARSPERAAPVLEAIRARTPGADVELLPFDIAELAEVREAAARVLTGGRPLDVLVNNAGVAGTQRLTREGYDLTYATNHIGPHLLTNLLLPRLLEAPAGRVVNVASVAHKQVKAVDWSVLDRRTEPRRSGFADYAVTKLMNVLHAKELARRLAGTRVTTYAVHPGGVASNIWRKVPQPLRWFLMLFLVSNEEGADTPLYCAASPAVAGASGRYYYQRHEVRVNPLAEDPALARELWDRTERAIAPR